MFLNLAASDIIFGVASLLTPILIFPQTDGICSLSLSLNGISGVACSTGIMLLAFDIMATVLYPDLNYTPLYLSLPFVRTVIGLTWLLTLALGIWIAVEVRSCSVNALFQFQSTAVAVYLIIVQALISFTCYGVTFAITTHRIKKLKAELTSENLPLTSVIIRRLQRNIKMAKLVVSLGILYLVSHGPNIVMVTAGHLFGVSLPHHLVALTAILVPLNSLGNCVIYWWRSLEFRRIWQHMFSCISTNRIQPN